jgi:DNA primase
MCWKTAIIQRRHNGFFSIQRQHAARRRGNRENTQDTSMTGAFEMIKERVPIQAAAEMYGIAIQRGKALCPFHSDTHPSMSFKNNHFTCWACGAHGSVIDLIAKLTGETPINTVKRLNDAFHCGLDMDRPADHSEVVRFKQRQELQLRFEIWEENAFAILRAYNFYIQAIIKTYAPKTPDAPQNTAFTAALHDRERVGYLLDILTFGTAEDKIQLYNVARTEVNRYGQLFNSTGFIGAGGSSGFETQRIYKPA